MTQGYVYGWAATFGAVRRDGPLTGLNARRLLKLVAYTGVRTWAPRSNSSVGHDQCRATDYSPPASCGPRVRR
jgi:hypothetical protein